MFDSYQTFYVNLNLNHKLQTHLTKYDPQFKIALTTRKQVKPAEKIRFHLRPKGGLCLLGIWFRLVDNPEFQAEYYTIA